MRISLSNHPVHHLEFRVYGKQVLLDVEDPDEVLIPSDWPIFLTDNLKLSSSEREGTVLDLGTGSGILAIALYKMGCTNVDASDISRIALETARENLRLNDFGGNSDLIQSDVFDKISKHYELIVTNPPTFPDEQSLRRNHYIDYAFFAGSDGRGFIDKVIESVDKFLVEGGRLMMLHPSYLNTNLTIERLKKKNFKTSITASRNVSLNDYAKFLTQNGYDGETMKVKTISNAKTLGSELKYSDSKSSYEFTLDLVEAIKIPTNLNTEGFRP